MKKYPKNPTTKKIYKKIKKSIINLQNQKIVKNGQKSENSKKS